MKKYRLVIAVAGVSLVCVALIALWLGRPDSGTRQPAPLRTGALRDKSAAPAANALRTTSSLRQSSVLKEDALTSASRSFEIYEKEWPLHAAAAMGNLERIKSCIAKGMDSNARDANGDSPLMYAVYGGQLEVVRYLLDHGADVNRRNSDGRTALHMAAYGGHADMLELLLARGADIRAEMPGIVATPLHCAALYGRVEAAKFLLLHGASVNAKDREMGITPLHLAASVGQDAMIAFLKSQGADDSIRDVFGLTPSRLGALMREREKRRLLPVRAECVSFDPRAIVMLVEYRIADKKMEMGIPNSVVIGDGTIILTAGHLVRQEGALKGVFAFSPYLGDMCEAKMLAMDEEKDLAAFRVPWEGHPAFSVAEEGDVEKTKDVIVAGYPPFEGGDNSVRQVMMEPLSLLKVFPEDGPYRRVEEEKKRPFGIALGEARYVGKGWSGSPMIIIESGRLAGIQTSRTWRVQDENTVLIYHVFGPDARAIRSFLRSHGVSGWDASPKASAIPSKDAPTIFDTFTNLVRAVLKGDSAAARSKQEELYRMRTRSPVPSLLVAWSAGESTRYWVDAGCTTQTLPSRSSLNAGPDAVTQWAEFAEFFFREALQIDPDCAVAHAGYGHLLTLVGRDKEAIAEFDKFLALEPGQPFVVSARKAALERISGGPPAGGKPGRKPASG